MALWHVQMVWNGLGWAKQEKEKKDYAQKGVICSSELHGVKKDTMNLSDNNCMDTMSNVIVIFLSIKYEKTKLYKQHVINWQNLQQTSGVINLESGWWTLHLDHVREVWCWVSTYHEQRVQSKYIQLCMGEWGWLSFTSHKITATISDRSIVQNSTPVYCGKGIYR